MRFEHDTRVGLERAFLSAYAQKQYRRTAHPAQKPKSKTQKGVGAPETAGADPNFKETRGMLPFDFSKCSDFCGVDLADYKPNLQMTKSCRYHPKICAGLASRNLLRFCHLRMITKPKNEITNHFESCHPCFHKSQKGSAQIPKGSA